MKNSFFNLLIENKVASEALKAKGHSLNDIFGDKKTMWLFNISLQNQFITLS